MSGWLRRNRWGLAALPVAFGLAMLASSQRVADLWWDVDLRDAAPVSADGTARYSAPYEDASGTHDRAVEITLLSITPADEVAADDTFGEAPPYVPPDGTQVWQVELGFAADPDVPLSGCLLAIVTTTGDVLGTPVLVLEGTPRSDCVPSDAPGPLPDLGGELGDGSSPDDPVRPDTWTTTSYVLADVDAVPAEVRVWWAPPDYVSLEVPAAG